MPPKIILSLDVGDKRIGLAQATISARLPLPVGAVERDQNGLDRLVQLIQKHQVSAVIVGLPRGLEGQETDQTKRVRQFAQQLQQQIQIPLYLQDEAVTSRQAEAELRARGKPYTKAEVDSLAACYILEDWLGEHQEAI